VEEALAHTAAAEAYADSPEASFAGAGPSLQVEGFAVYGEDVVDRPPSVAVQVTPEYPQRARRMGVEGRVEVSLVVDVEGKPQACAVRKAVPAGYFEEAALAAARKTRFIPGMVRGRPVNTLAHISFVFVLR
jgi:protein TonB